VTGKGGGKTGRRAGEGRKDVYAMMEERKERN
jgi:hypothetical protein